MAKKIPTNDLQYLWKLAQQISWCHPKKITATSRNTVGGKEVVGAILGFQTSQKALERSLLTSKKRTHTTYRTVWM